MKLGTSYGQYVHLQLRASYATMRIYLDMSRIRVVDYYHQCLSMKNRHHVRDCTVLSTDNYLEKYPMAKNLEP